MFLGAVSPNCWNCFGPVFCSRRHYIRSLKIQHCLGIQDEKIPEISPKFHPLLFESAHPGRMLGFLPVMAFWVKVDRHHRGELDHDWTMTHDPLRLTWIVLKASFPSQLDSLQQTAYIRGPYLSSHTSGTEFFGKAP